MASRPGSLCSGNALSETLSSLQPSERLTDDVLLQIFSFLSEDFGPTAQATSSQTAAKAFLWFRRSLPNVCRRWAALLCGGGKYPWDSVVVSVEQECLSRRQQTKATNTTLTGPGPQSPGSSAAVVSGSSPSSGLPALIFARPSLGSARVKLRSSSVIAWAEAHSGGIQHLLVDFERSSSHDFDGAHALDALLRATNRGARGLRTLRLYASGDVGCQESYDMLGRLRGLAELHISGLPQNFLAGTLPYLSSLSALTRLAFTPEAFQFPVTVPTLPSHLQVLSLHQIWINRLPPLSTITPQLREVELLRCFIVDGVLSALADAPCLAVLRLDGSTLTNGTGTTRVPWEDTRTWPPCPSLRLLSLASCTLRMLPPGSLAAFPELRVLDLSNNPDLGGASTDRAASAPGGFPSDLSRLTALADVRLASCGLTAVPPALLHIPSITALDFSTNSLSALPLPLLPTTHGSITTHGTATAGGAGARTSGGGQSAGGYWPWPGTNTAAVPTGAFNGISFGPMSPGRGAPPPPPAAFNPPLGGAGPAGSGGGAASGSGAGGVVAVFADRLVRLNIAINRFTVWPQGLLACSRLRELVLGAPLVARAPDGELERCIAAMPELRRLEVRGATFEPKAVRSLLALQRLALAAGRPVVEVTGV